MDRSLPTLLRRIVARLSPKALLRFVWAFLTRLRRWYSRGRAAQQHNASGRDTRLGEGPRRVEFVKPSTEYVCTSRAPDAGPILLSVEPSNAPGLSSQAADANENMAGRSTTPNSFAEAQTYFPPTFQHTPDDGASMKTNRSTITLGPHITASTNHPSHRTRLRQSASRASVRQSSVSVTVVGPTGDEPTNPPSMCRTHSQGSRSSAGSQPETQQSHLTHSSQGGYVTSPAPSLRPRSKLSLASDHLESQRPISVDMTSLNQSQPSDSPTTPFVAQPVIPTTSTISDNFDSNIRIAPMMPHDVMDERYFSPIKQVEKRTDRVIPIPAQHSDYAPEDVGGGWKWYVHPEGSTYFYHSQFRIYTTSDLFDPSILGRANALAAEMLEAAEYVFDEGKMPLDVECVISTRLSDDGEWEDRYYYVDNSKRVLLWLVEYCVSIGKEGTAFQELHGCREVWHLSVKRDGSTVLVRCIIQHVMVAPLQKPVINELLAILVSCGHDGLIAINSSSPYSVEDSQKMIYFVKNLERVWDLEDNSRAVHAAARTFALFAHERAMNYHGMDIARLERNQCVYVGTKHTPTALIRVMSPFLFFAPDVHLQMLNSLWVDETINSVAWNKFLQKAREEWRDLMVMATVLLAVDTALLAIPSVDDGFTVSRSAVQVLAYISTISSVGTILTSLLLIRQYQIQERSTAAEAAQHIMTHQHHDVGLETMAILHSLPYASLMWAMTAFVGAFCALVFARTDTVPRASFGVVFAIIALLTYWCIYDAWSGHEWYARMLDGTYVKQCVRVILGRPASTDGTATPTLRSTYAPSRPASAANVATPARVKSAPHRRWWKQIKSTWAWHPSPPSSQLPMHVIHPSSQPPPSTGGNTSNL